MIPQPLRAIWMSTALLKRGELLPIVPVVGRLTMRAIAV